MTAAQISIAPESATYRERAFRFGAHGGLVGVLTEPAPELAVVGAPVVLVANIGLNHHVGPYRLWVDLARALARSGFSTFRFDTAGLGDSEPRRETVSDVERAVLDLNDAAQLLGERIGATRFVPMAMCSGVDAVHRFTVRDGRVVGAAFLDGYAHRTTGYRLRYWTGRWLQWRRWRRFVRRRWIYKLASATRGVRETGEVNEIFVREYPSLAELERDFDAVLGRGAKLLFAFSGEVDHSYNAKKQLFEMFPRFTGLASVTNEYYHGADHVYSFIRDRRVLIERLCSWVKDNFVER